MFDRILRHVIAEQTQLLHIMDFWETQGIEPENYNIRNSGLQPVRNIRHITIIP